MTKVVHITRFLIKSGFYVINIFGIIFSTQKLSAVVLNHERIHTAQQRELLFIGFYLWYIVEIFCKREQWKLASILPSAAKYYAMALSAGKIP